MIVHALLFAVLLLASPAQASEAFRGEVTRITDGDTLWVQPDSGGRPRKLRIEGIDAPEICQAGGEAARSWLSALALHRSVDIMVSGRDVYGRGLAKMVYQGQDVGLQMVREGLAWSYRWRGSLGPYAREEAQSRQARLGVFADRGAELPAEFRRRHGPCPSTR